MKRDMRKWLNDQIAASSKKPMPILSYPCIQLMGITVNNLISSSDNQAKGMKLISEKVDSAVSLGLMDLSLEAECFASQIRFSDDEVPTVIGSVVTSMEDEQALAVPAIGAGRTSIYIEAAKKACEMINDKPVIAGTIGPFSLASRIVGVSEAMIFCYEEPKMMHNVLSKAAEFLISYIKKKKKTGANGIIMAEPVTGMLSPDLAREFSQCYVKRITDAVRDENFIIIYHNCGNAVIQMIDSILAVNADAYHFGNSIDMAEMLKHIPQDIAVMGNISPAEQFRGGTPESIGEATLDLLEKCGKYPNFIISSGCDIPPLSSWKNIDAFFNTVNKFYGR
jgi:uroporphyrinogen decarboxylase